MSENTMPEQDEVALNATPPPAEGAPNAAEERLSRMLTPEQLAAVKGTISKFVTTEKKTESGSEAVAEDLPPGEQKTITGRDVDWNEYELEFNLRHLYPRATLREVDGIPRWVVMLEEFLSADRSWEGYGKMVGPAKEPLNLGEFLGDKLNGPENWRPVAILPGSVGRVGVLLQKQVPFVLPDPKPLKKETEVPAPGDPELQRVEDAAMDFIEREGLTPKPSTPLAPPEQVALELNGPAERVPSASLSRRENEDPSIADAAGKRAAELLQGPDTPYFPEGGAQ